MVKFYINSFIKSLDWLIISSLFFISCVGLLGVYSATYSGGISGLFLKQFVYITVGWFVILFLSRLNFRVVLEYAPIIYGINLFLLVLVPFVGKTVYGAKRWIDLGPVNIQPSEFMKFSLLLLSAYALTRITQLWSKEFFMLLLAFAIPSVLVVKQPDLGTTITYLVILLSALFFWGLKLRYFLGLFVLLILSSPLFWLVLKDYQKSRILAVLDPYRDYTGSGYQLIQSIIAVGSGGFLGKGFLQGTQSHLLFLPEKHTDFVFSVIAEEMGFWLGSLLISSFFLLVWRLLSYIPRADIKEEVLFLGTFSSLLLFQVFVNFAMTMGLAPVVGMPLPFVSYGGSSILTFSLLFGLSLSVIEELRSKPINFNG
ncbi:rod shape-determining protein RodA [Thermocrinis sp.]